MDRVARVLVDGQSILGVPVSIQLVEHIPTVILRDDPAQWRLLAIVDGQAAARVCMPHGPVADFAPVFDAIATFGISLLNAVSGALAQHALGAVDKIAAGEEPPT